MLVYFLIDFSISSYIYWLINQFSRFWKFLKIDCINFPINMSYNNWFIDFWKKIPLLNIFIYFTFFQLTYKIDTDIFPVVIQCVVDEGESKLNAILNVQIQIWTFITYCRATSISHFISLCGEIEFWRQLHFKASKTEAVCWWPVLSILRNLWHWE